MINLKAASGKMLSKILTYLFCQQKGLLVITIVYLVTIILMLPLRDVAFEDDFAYIQTAEHLYKTGTLQISDWSASAIIFQTYWGVMFAKIFGFSIKILHLSNLVLLYFGLSAFYLLLKRLRAGEFKAVIFTISLLGFPWVFQFAYSFMSDVFYMSLLIISLYFYVRAFQDQKLRDYIFGSTFAGLAFLNRQIGIVIPASAIIVLIYQVITTRKIYWQKLISASLPVSLFVFSYNLWISSVGPPLSYIYHVLNPLKEEYLPYILPFHLKRINITSYQYIEALILRGLGYFFNVIVFLLPIFLIFKFEPSQTIKFLRKNIRAILICTVILAAAYYIDTIYHNKLSKYPPDLLLRYEKVLLNWDIWWPKLIAISLPIWIVIITVSIKGGFNSLFSSHFKPRNRLFIKLIGVYILAFLLFLLAATQASFPSLFSSLGADFLSKAKLFSISEYSILTLKDSWFFFLVIFSLIVFITYISLNKKIKKLNSLTAPLLFVVLTLISTVFILLFLNSFYYQEYIIQFIPMIIILIAYLFKNVKINYTQSFIAVCIILFFAMQTTRYRYQFEGIKWQLANQLVAQGINPYNIATNWPWRPYWFFESSFASAVKEFGGNKYNVPEGRIGNWFAGTPPGDRYYFLLTSADPKKSQSEIYNKEPQGDKIVIQESETFWLFWGLYKIIVIKDLAKN